MYKRVHNPRVCARQAARPLLISLGPTGSCFLITSVSEGLGAFEAQLTWDLEDPDDIHLLLSGRVRARGPDDQPPPELPAPSHQGPGHTITGQDVLDDLAAKGLTFCDKYRALHSIQVTEEGNLACR